VVRNGLLPVEHRATGGFTRDYIYGKNDSGIWVNLYIGSNTTLKIGKTDVPVKMETNYPWEGAVKLTVNPVKKTPYALHLRIPGWVSNVPVPGDLYRFTDEVKPLSV
jgi:DUF1680 family protein